MHKRGRMMVGLTMAAMLAIAAAACGSSSNKSSSTTTGAAQRSSGNATSNTASGYATGNSGSASASGSGSTSGATVSVVHNAKYGDILTGPNGHTLYLFEADKGTTTACGTDPCKTIWPALAASSGKPTGASGVQAAKLTTAMGQVPNQIVYNGHLLYYFSGDMSAGQVNGTSIPMWYPVSPTGEKVDKS